MTDKLRVLWVGESSSLNTGYGVYAREVLNRLYHTDKYIIAELGCYSTIDNPKRFDIPWKFYANLPTNEQEGHFYNANPLSQFGEWRFEDVCLDFRPDVVIDIRDFWMSEFIERSPYRPFFNWAIMPTVDSTPQQEQYLATYMNADAVFTYSEFGKEVLETESEGSIKVIDIPSPGADFNVMLPSPDKNKHREQAGFVDDITIIGTVMRNQRRKLYPNLIQSFRKMLDQHPEMLPNTFLYIHTSYPDIGWDIPQLIRKNRMGNHTLLTYICNTCNHFFPTFFQDAKTACPKCGAPDARLPNTQVGVSPQQFASIFNWFDLYVQYSICEGFGMPQVEAAACGVPVLTVDYSAMQSVGRNLKADLITLCKGTPFHWDGPTGSMRANPDDDDLIAKMVKFIKSSKSSQNQKGMATYIQARKHYNWDKTAGKWEKYLDTVTPKPLSQTWDSSPRLHQPNTEPPKGLINEELVRWGIANTWGELEKMNSYTALRFLRDLNYGKAIGQHGTISYNEASYLTTQMKYQPFSSQDVIDKMKSLCERRNYWERRRVGIDNPPKPYFISSAKPDNKEIEGA